MTNKIIQCVPNYSEGRDKQKVEAIANCFRNVDGVKLLDYSSDVDHNRTVVTIAGEPQAVAECVIRSVGVAKELIDLNKHQGQHPRMGAVDVIPFIPIQNVPIEEALEVARMVGQKIYQQFEIPIYFYERSATASHRENLADIRKGQFEGLVEKMQNPLWQPDFGSQPHPTFGASVVGVRQPLVAFNVNLDTDKLEIADKIAKRVRFSGGGLRFVKAMAAELVERKQAQVSMNLTDYTKTPLYAALEAVRMEARRYGVSVVGSEVVGLVPLSALLQSTEYYMQIEGFSLNQISFSQQADSVLPIAFNVNLNTKKLSIAEKIAKSISFFGGGLRFVQAAALELQNKQIQISMNLTDYKQTPLYAVLEHIRTQAKRFGVTVKSTEVLGVLPLNALVKSAEYYMQIENYSINQVLEERLNQK